MSRRDSVMQRRHGVSELVQQHASEEAYSTEMESAGDTSNRAASDIPPTPANSRNVVWRLLRPHQRPIQKGPFHGFQFPRDSVTFEAELPEDGVEQIPGRAVCPTTSHPPRRPHCSSSAANSRDSPRATPRPARRVASSARRGIRLSRIHRHGQRLRRHPPPQTNCSMASRSRSSPSPGSSNRNRLFGRQHQLTREIPTY